MRQKCLKYQHLYANYIQLLILKNNHSIDFGKKIANFLAERRPKSPKLVFITFQDENLIYRLIFFGGIQPNLRKKASRLIT
jgi:hypothetical protein